MSATLLENTATLEDVLQEVSRINGIVTGTVEYGVRSAMRMAKQGRHAAEDAIDDARSAVKKNPFEAVAVVLNSRGFDGCPRGVAGDAPPLLAGR